jgi:hypothetical protein
MNPIREPISQDDEGAYQIDEELKHITEIGIPKFRTFGQFQLKYLARRDKNDLIVDKSFLDGDPKGPPVVIFKVEDFIVGKEGAGQVNLCRILDSKVRFITGEFANLQYRPPELHKKMIALNTVATDSETGNPLVMIGNLDTEEASTPLPEYYYEPSTVVEEIVWNVLVANFFSQFGMPADKEAGSMMRVEVEKVRNELLKLLVDGKGDMTKVAYSIANFGAE